MFPGYQITLARNDQPNAAADVFLIHHDLLK